MFFVKELTLSIVKSPLTLGNGKVIIVGPRRFYIKEIGAFTGSHPFREDFVFIRVFQGCTTSLQKISLDLEIYCPGLTHVNKAPAAPHRSVLHVGARVFAGL